MIKFPDFFVYGQIFAAIWALAVTAWVVFFGATACIKYHMHPTIDLLVKLLPRGLRLGHR